MGRVLGEAAATAAMAKLDTGGTGCSFDADTPVATLDGQRAIGALQVGDTVLAFNEATGMLEADPITHVWVNHDPAIEQLTLSGETLDTTPEHPFFTSERGWVAAGELLVGEHVRRLDGSWGVIEQLTIEARPVVMYNLTVARAHTFFVGDEGWLVHNTCGQGLAKAADDALKSLDRDLRKATIGAARGAEGNLVYSVYHRTAEGTVAAVDQLRGKGYNVLDAPMGRGPKYHAERQLYAEGYTEIGISRQKGMCKACNSYLPRRGVTVTPYEP